jgi:hypothetical protein
MFLAAVARPIFDHSGSTIFDGKVGIDLSFHFQRTSEAFKQESKGWEYGNKVNDISH